MSREKPFSMTRVQKIALDRLVAKFLPNADSANFPYRTGVQEYADVRDVNTGKLLAKFIWYPDKQIWVPITQPNQVKPPLQQKEVQNARS